VGYVVAKGYRVEADETGVVKAELIERYREGLAGRLPEYMAPARIVLLEELPLTANGKVDRKALPAPEEEDGTAALYVGPRNAIEQAMCEVWHEVLKAEQVGIRDNFFSLGGDSILSIRVVGMLKSRGIKVEIKDIFQYQTIERLALQANQFHREQPSFIDSRQVTQLLISEHDQLNPNVIETLV
jgi:aryl carrier-like protein